MNSKIVLFSSRLVLLALLIVVGYLSLIPGPDMPLPSVWDKAKHFAAYAALGFWGAFSVKRHINALKVAAGIILYGFLLEAAQGLSPDRIAGLDDGLANIFGTVFGLVLGSILKKLFPKFWIDNGQCVGGG